MFSGKDDPEAEEDGVEESLADVAVQDHERHVQHQRQPVNRDCNVQRHAVFIISVSQSFTAICYYYVTKITRSFPLSDSDFGLCVVLRRDSRHFFPAVWLHSLMLANLKFLLQCRCHSDIFTSRYGASVPQARHYWIKNSHITRGHFQRPIRKDQKRNERYAKMHILFRIVIAHPSAIRDLIKTKCKINISLSLVEEPSYKIT